MTCTKIYKTNQNKTSFPSKKVSVLKFGGDILENQEKLHSIIKKALFNRDQFGNLIIVHGWGKDLDQMQKEANIEIIKKNGLRFTDIRTLSLCSILAKKYNFLISKMVENLGFQVVGFQGKNNEFMKAKQKEELGLIGEIDKKSFKKEVLFNYLNQDFVPIFSPLIQNLNSNQSLLNINADNLAGFLAGELESELFFFSEVGGVLDEQKNLITELDHEKHQKLSKLGVISGGMVPKLEEAFKSLENGAKTAYILNDISAL